MKTEAADVRDTLSPIGDKRPAHVPLAINHDIDGLGCVMRPDGTLMLERSPRPLVRLEPRLRPGSVHALAGCCGPPGGTERAPDD